MSKQILSYAVLGLLLASLGAIAHDDPAHDDEAARFAGVEIKTTPLRGGLFMLTGAGGNLLAGAGEDGAFLVDDQFAPLHQRIRDALKVIHADPPRFIINTHWHGDHTGGNAAFGAEGVVIVAQDNVRKRMSVEQVKKLFKQTIPPSPKAALPVITFNHEVSLHLNGDTAHVIHIEHAHTDGDALVHFEHANVLHMGDVFFNGMYPFIDLDSGGDIDGMIAGAERGLALSNAETLIVVGHGPLAKRTDLQAYHAMLKAIRDKVAALKASGKTRDAVIAAKPSAEYDARFGQGFIKPEVFVGFVFDSV